MVSVPLTTCVLVAVFLTCGSLTLAYRGFNGWTGADCLLEKQRELCKDNRECLDTTEYLAGNRVACKDGESTSCKCWPPNDEFKSCVWTDSDCDRWERCVFTDFGPNGKDLANRICMSCYNMDKKPFEDAGRRKIEHVDNTPPQCSIHPYGGTGPGAGSGNQDGSGGNQQSRPPNVSPTPSPPVPASITPFPKGGSTTAPTPTPPVCVDAKLISDPVYPTHRTGAVLCDYAGSCATPGHIVTFYGRPMMMASYCRIAAHGCSKRVMLVNSPRVRGRKTRVRTHTDGLEMTALAARYETMAEELVLKALVHLGA